MPRSSAPRSGALFAAIAAATLLAGCQVDVNGAPCTSPGDGSDCPDGQACGNDLRCSARALACADSRCVPDASFCSTTAVDTAIRCDGNVDPVCGRLVVDDCGARGMLCPIPGSGACECPSYAGTTVVADPLRGSRHVSAPPFPTGQREPPECRFGRLWDALAAASSLAPSAATVEIDGAAGAPVVFGAATAEVWPLTVAANVTVLAAPAPAGTTIIIRGAPGAATLVDVRGTIDGIRIEGGGALGVGVATSCGAAGSPSLRHVVVAGGGALDPDGLVTAGLSQGVAVSGACGARLTGLEVSRVAGAALTIGPVDPTGATTVEVLGGSFGASNTGIWLRGGRVSLRPDPETATSVTASGNAWEGIVMGGHDTRLPTSGTALEAALERASVGSNGGTGLVLAGLPATSRLRISACDLHANGAARAIRHGGGTSPRWAGGALVSSGSVAAFEFRGNRFWGNESDQLAVESTASWSIAPVSGACGPESNVFVACAGGCDEGRCAVTVSGGGSVDARFSVWPAVPAYPTYVPLGVTGSSAWCLTEPGLPAIPTCP